ncbi:hypothetical protein V6N11_078474 [Hibiscus sabdariffa]|uniref:GTD-binding domain-containing protein n=1 Tax=Hibiscus sabdariffa TaxID=183260 RepID=A0ABR2TG55_9ROSI
MGKRSFKQFVEEELGAVPEFFIYAVLEWIMILMLFIGGFVASVANGFAKFFELPVPCLVCTRLDHVFLGTTDDFDFDESICDSHKKGVSCLAFCHAHKKLSDIRTMCETCLLSFATERETDCNRYKSLLGILHKDLDQLLVDEDHELHLSLHAGAKKDEDPAAAAAGSEKRKGHICTCCGQPLNVKSTGPKAKFSSIAPSPHPDNSSHIKHPEPEFKPDEPEAPEDTARSRGLTLQMPLKEDGKAGTMPMAAEGDEEDKSPSMMKSKQFFGIPLSDSDNSPRWARTPRKILLQRTEFAAECNGEIPCSPRMDRKSLMALYMELDEERSASAVAAYNAMAMITRLQAEKAAVQMEALQYQRMMEEQAEYDQETLEEMTNLVAKREEELCELEAELEVYRAKYGRLQESDFEKLQRNENDEVNNQNNDSHTVETPSLSSSNGGKPETASTTTTTTTTTTWENSETQKVQAESNSSSTEKVGAAADSDPTGGESTAKSKKAMRQMDRMKILEKKMHITSMGRFQRQNSEIDDDFEEDH